MKLYAGLLFLLISFDSAAQQKGVAVTFCPLAALDGISFPTIQAGLQYRLGRRFSWYNEFGIQYGQSSVDLPDTVILRPHGIKAKTELRYFVNRSRYIAFNVFLTSDAHNTQVLYFKNVDTMVRTDAFGVRKQVLGWNVVYGWEKRLHGRFWVDMYFGVGMRFRYIRTVDEQLNSQDQLIRSIDFPNLPTIRATTDSKDGWSVVPNLTAGVRVMYRL